MTLNKEHFIFKYAPVNKILNCDRAETKAGDYYYSIDYSGNVYLKTKYRLSRLNNYYITFSKDKIFGIIDNDGNIKAPLKYGYIDTTFGKNDLYYTFRAIDKFKWGLIDNNGDIKIPAVYDSDLEYLGETFYTTVLNGKDGVVNVNGDVILPFEYDDSSINLLNYKKDRFIVGKNGKYGVVNLKNEVLIPFEYDYICQTFTNGKFKDCLFAKLNGKEGIINENNKIIIPLKYATIRILSDETLLVANNDGDLEYIADYDFNKICDTEYSDIGLYSEYGLANVSKNIDGCEGIIDKYGNIKIECKYKELLMIQDRPKESKLYFRAVNQEGKCGIIDEDDNVIIPFEFDTYSFYCINDDYTAIASKGRKYGVINTKSNSTVIDFIFDSIEPFYNQETTFAKYNGKWGLIDKQGNSFNIELKKVKTLEI